MSDWQRNRVGAFMSGVVYAGTVRGVEARLETYAEARAFPEGPRKWLVDAIKAWWDYASKTGRVYPRLQSWIWRDRACFVQMAGDLNIPPELLEELLPAWPDGWATTDEPTAS